MRVCTRATTTRANNCDVVFAKRSDRPRPRDDSVLVESRPSSLLLLNDCVMPRSAADSRRECLSISTLSATGRALFMRARFDRRATGLRSPWSPPPSPRRRWYHRRTVIRRKSGPKILGHSNAIGKTMPIVRHTECFDLARICIWVRAVRRRAADRMSASRPRRFRDVFMSCCTPAT